MSFLEPVDLSAMRYIEGGHAEPYFQRNDFLSLDQVNEYRTHFGNRGVYLTAYLYDNIETIEESNLYADFYMDFDSDDDIQLAQNDAIMAIWYMKQKFKFGIPENMFRIYFSGAKGFHVVIPAAVFHVRPCKELNEHYKLIAKDVSEQTKNGTLDLKVYDRRRLFRMVNSMHQKTGLYKVPLTFEELCNLTPDEVREKAKSPYVLEYPRPEYIPTASQEYLRYVERFEERFKKRFDTHRNNDSTLDFTPACVQNLLDQGPVSGQRNHTIAVLTSFFAKRGLSEQETWNELVKWNNGSVSERELKTTMQSILKRGVNYGCSTLEEISICIGADCPLFKRDR